MTDKGKLICRKCGTPNSRRNDYCRQCGAVLNVATAEIRAQRRPVMPTVKGLSWRWVGVSALTILGLEAVLLGLLAGVASLAMGGGAESQVRDLSAALDEFLGMAVAICTVFLLAFGLAGVVVAWLSKGRTVTEPVLAAILVLVLLGVVGSVLTEDAPWLAAIFVLPSAALAALGGRIGELIQGQRGRR